MQSQLQLGKKDSGPIVLIAVFAFALDVRSVACNELLEVWILLRLLLRIFRSPLQMLLPIPARANLRAHIVGLKSDSDTVIPPKTAATQRAGLLPFEPSP
jgi:hypothetical protein